MFEELAGSGRFAYRHSPLINAISEWRCLEPKPLKRHDFVVLCFFVAQLCFLRNVTRIPYFLPTPFEKPPNPSLATLF
jgi:hypothetical protein